jgi:hypothetical protein
MKILIKGLYCLLPVLFCTNCLMAQESKLPVDSLAAREARYLTEKLSLSSEQEVSIHLETKLNLKKLDSLNLHSQLEKDREQAIAQELRAYRQKLNDVLTSEQYAVYVELLKQRKSAFKTYTDQKRIPVHEVVE